MAFLGGLSLLGSAGQSYRDIQEQQAQTAARRRQLQDQTDAQQGSLAIGSIPPEAWGGTIPGVAGGAAPGGPQMPAGGAAGAAAGIQPPPQQPAGGAPTPGGGQSGAPVSFNYPQQQQQNPIMAALQQLARGLTPGAGGGQPPMPFVPRDMQGGPGATQNGGSSQPSNGDTGFDTYRDPNQTMRQRTGLDQPGQPGRPFGGGGQQVAQAQQPTQPWQPGKPIQTMADLAGAIRRYNPGISPRAFAHAMSIGMKLLGQEAQQEYMRQRPELQREAISERERAAEMAHPGSAAFFDDLVKHPEWDAQQVGAALNFHTGKAQMLEQRGRQARELEETKQTGRTALEAQKQTGRETIVGQKAQAAKELEGVKEFDRESLAKLNADSRAGLEKQKADYAKANFPFGRSAEGMSMYLYFQANEHATIEDYWAAKAKSRPETAGQVRQREIAQSAKATSEDIDRAIDLLVQNPNVSLTGVGGMIERFGEFGRTVTGRGSQETPGGRFQQMIRSIQSTWSRSVAQTRITNAQERAHLDEIIGGLGKLTSRQEALDSLQEAKRILARHAGLPAPGSEEEEDDSGGASRGKTEPIRRDGPRLKPIDDEMHATIIQMNKDGFSGAQIRAYVRKKGYDPDS